MESNSYSVGISKVVSIFLLLVPAAYLVEGSDASESPTSAASAQAQRATSSSTAVSQSQPPPAMVQNGQPGEMHKRMDALIGQWDVEKKLYIAGGTPEKPLVSRDLTCNREWIAETGNRHLRDITQGTVAGSPYYRLGILSFSTMDRRYEWNTVDGLNANMMTYKGLKNSATISGDIAMSGEFTDQGVLGDSSVGKNIAQRTVIKIESPDRHVFELYFTPPGEKERLVDRTVYTRHR
jgi:Protein of unknown function (DUF1579)